MSANGDGGMLEVFVDREEDHLVVRVAGEVDMSTVGDLETVLLQAVDGRSRVVQLDLSGVEFFGSDGVRLLVAARIAAADAGVSLTVDAASPVVRRVLDVTGTVSPPVRGA